MWEPKGRKIELSAKVKNGTVHGKIYPNLKYGLNGRHLIVATEEVWFILLYDLVHVVICN